ncbi:hypothetical protein K505DRAFT_261690, partial [Melanomma pulvis-pyrius CBS 109.77]
VNKELIVFFYVNNIVVLYYSNNCKKHNDFAQRLLNTFSIYCLGPLKWFLGIRVVRDHLTSTVYLIQDSFINKVAV